MLDRVLDTFRMEPNESLLITHALAALEEIVKDRSPGSKQGPALQLALRALLPHAGDHPHYLYDFWLFAGYEQQEARCHNCRKTFGPVAGSVGRPNYRSGL